MVMIPPGWSDLGNGQYQDENGNLVQEKALFIRINSLLVNNLFAIRLLCGFNKEILDQCQGVSVTMIIWWLWKMMPMWFIKEVWT